MDQLIQKKDVVAILPTGFGKSIIYQAYPFIYSLYNGIELPNLNKYVMVITPLNSLSENQIKECKEKGIAACAIEFNAEGLSEMSTWERGIFRSTEVPGYILSPRNVSFKGKRKKFATKLQISHFPLRSCN